MSHLKFLRSTLVLALVAATVPSHAQRKAAQPVAAPQGSTLKQTTAPGVAGAPATMRGTVLDPDGAAVPGATITLTPASGPAITVPSGDDGSYSIPSIPAGTYSITVTLQGFASAVRQNVKFANGQAITLDANLSIQEQATEINVTASTNSVSVDQDSNASAVTIKDADLDALSDDPDELQSELTALAGPSAGPDGGQVYIDGFTGGQLPPKSSIREIRVNQNPFSAQYDRPGFGRVEILTKPGTDKLHGNFTSQGNTAGFNTSSPFLGAQNIQPGYYNFLAQGSVTGPINSHASFSIGGSHRNIQTNAIFSGQLIQKADGSAPGVLCTPGDTTCSLQDLPASQRATFQPQTRDDIAPRLDLALSDRNTLTVRYSFERNDSQNNGIGGTSLSSLASNQNTNENTIQISDSQIVSDRIINETRFEYQRDHSDQNPLNATPNITLSGVFSAGGSTAGTSHSDSTHWELQNYTSVQLKKNFLRLGGRLRTNQFNVYSTAGSNGTFTYASQADYIANRPRQFNVSRINQTTISGNYSDVGLYAETDWKIRPNLTWSYGGRYEAQQGVHSNRDIAPRTSIAWGVPHKGGNPVTVLRAGYGVFYNRFQSANFETVLQQQPSVQQSFVVKTPNGVLCNPGNINGCAVTNQPVSVYTLGDIRSSYNLQAAVGIDQQLGRAAKISIQYLNTRGLHSYMSRAFAPGQLPAGDPLAGVNATNYIYRFDSGGVFNQNQIIVNGNYSPSRSLSFFGYYAYSIANSDTNGAGTFQTNAFNPKQDYGRTGFNQSNRLFMAGSWTLPYLITFSPFMTANSGSPYSITTGTDVNGDSQFNDRATLATGVTNPRCTVASDFAAPSGTTNNYNPIAPNTCTGPASFNFNLRIAKAIGWGGPRNGAAGRRDGSNSASNGGNNGGGGLRGGGGQRGGGGGPRGGGGGPFGGGASTGQKYSLSFGAQAFNLFNVVNYNAPVSTITSPQFGQSIGLQRNGFGNSSAVRTIFLQASFNF